MPAKKQSLPRWQPPNNEEIKINLDGAFIPGNSFGGWGVVARDVTGQIIVARAGHQDHIHTAFGVEVSAMAAAVATAADIGDIRVVFETDFQLLADALNIWTADSSPYAAIIEDTKFQLKMWFSKFSVLACRRSANSVAHELAQIGRMCLPNECMEWNSTVPPNVAVCVMADMPEHR